MQRLILIAAMGAMGTLARYWLSLLIQRAAGGVFPWGTFAVNMIGSFLFGVVWSLAEERMVIDTETRGIILTGFMGAFTTFSTFMFDTGKLLTDGNWPLALGHVAAQVVIGLICLFVGLGLGRLF